MNTGKKQVVAESTKILAAFLDEYGGAEKFGRALSEDYQRTRAKCEELGGSNLGFEKLLHGKQRDIVSKIAEADRLNLDLGEFDDVSDADLIGLMMEQAVENITKNPLTAIKMMKVIRDHQPALFQQLVVTGEVPSPQHVIDMEIDNPDDLLDIPDDLLALTGDGDDFDMVATEAEEGHLCPT